MEQLLSPRASDYVLLISLISFGLLWVGRWLAPEQSEQLWRLPWLSPNDDFLETLHADRVRLMNFSQLLAALVMAPLGIMAFKFLAGFSEQAWTGWAEYARLFFIIALMYGLKSLLDSILGYVFSIQEELALVGLIFNQSLGKILLINSLLALACYFGKTPDFLLWIVLSTLGISLLFNLIASIRRALHLRAALPYIILYICALEITPLLYLIKLS